MESQMWIVAPPAGVGRQVLRSRRIVTPDGEVDGFLVVEGARIESIHPVGDRTPEGVIRDLGSSAILPGGIDPHVHLNEPGRESWEGMATGTRAAAAGGITLVVDMPLNSDPPAVTPAEVAAKRKTAEAHRDRGTLWTQLAAHAGLVPGNERAMEDLVDAGAARVKAFLTHSGIDEFPAVGERELRPAMELLARRGVPLWAHAELDSGSSPSATADPNAYSAWLASRPDTFETEAIALLLRLVRETGCPLHIVHLATAEALPVLSAAHAEGLPVTVETCPHYLTFAAEHLPDGDPRFKCAPPIRGKRHREALWRALGDGLINWVASDHSPAPPALKVGDLRSAWGGIASLQVSRSALWTEARKRGFGLDDLARWTSSAPARGLGLEACKGSLAPGYDADLVIFDPDARWIVVGAELEHRHPETAYEGLELHGRALATCIRGRWMWDQSGMDLQEGV